MCERGYDPEALREHIMSRVTNFQLALEESGGQVTEEIDRLGFELFDLVSIACGLPSGPKVIAERPSDSP